MTASAAVAALRGALRSAVLHPPAASTTGAGSSTGGALMGALRPFLSRASSAVGSLPLAPCFPCYPHPSNTRGAWQTLGLGAFRAPGLSFSSSCSSLRAATARQMAGPHLLPAFSSLKAFRGSARAYSSWSMMRGGGDAETAVYGLMASNCIVYLLWHLPVLSKEFMYANFTLTSSDVRQGRLLNLVTCTFSHIGLEHLLFNMLGLYCFGSPLARMLGPNRLMSFYIIGGLAGSLGHVLFTEWQKHKRQAQSYGSFFSRANEPRLLGASGAVYTLTSLFICLFPTSTILIFGIIPTPGWLFGLLYMGYDVRGLFTQGDGVGHAAHLGGALMGLAFYAAVRRGRLPF